MLIKSEFEVAESPEQVWEFFNDIPAVASCLPGADISEKVDDDTYIGTVVVALGPMKMNFAGQAHIRERDSDNKKLIVDASGMDEKGRGEAELEMDAAVTASGSGSKVEITQELHLSGAVAQYGRGMVQDVTAILLDQFSSNMTAKLLALETGVEHEAGSAKSASGFAIGLRALGLALARVARRFFLPYPSTD